MKKYMLSLSAVVLGTALAFAGQEKEVASDRAMQWFQLNPNVTGAGVSNPQNYTAVSSPQGCNANETRCAIYAESNQQSPARPTQLGVDDPEIESFKARVK